MDTLPNTSSSRSVLPAWYKIGAALLIMAGVVLFLLFAGISRRHRLYDNVQPGGAIPGKPNPVLPQ